MKIHKTIVKTALTAIVALGVAAESAKAAQSIHADYAGMNPQQVKREASRLRHIVDTAGPAMPAEFVPLVPAVGAFMHADATGTRELFTAVATGDLDPYVNEAKAAVADALDDYMDNVIMNAGNNAVILNTVANGGGAGQPADLLRDSFKAALRVAIHAPDTAALNGIDAAVDVPASLNLHVLSEVQRATFGAFGTVVENWIDTLLALDGPFLAVGVPVGHADEPADNTRDAFKAALVNVIDGINL
jgi:hypothetical protein